MRKALLLFALVALAQWAVPIWMVGEKEQVLHKGALYKFKLRPIDPSDPFLGEYVILDFAGMDGPYDMPDLPAEASYVHGFGALGVDTDGFARIDRVTLVEPDAEDHIRVTGYRYYSDADTSRIALSSLQPDFDRFYMEGGGRVAEDLVRWQPDTAMIREAYALVRVYHGEAIVQDLIIGNKPIHQWIKEERAQTVVAP